MHHFLLSCYAELQYGPEHHRNYRYLNIVFSVSHSCIIHFIGIIDIVVNAIIIVVVIYFAHTITDIILGLIITTWQFDGLVQDCSVIILLTHRIYCSLALSHWCISFIVRCLEYGDIFTYRLLHMNVVVVIRPDAIKVRYLCFISKLFFYNISLIVNLSFESQRKLNAIFILPFAMRNVRNILMRVDTYNKCSIAERTIFLLPPKMAQFVLYHVYSVSSIFYVITYGLIDMSNAYFVVMLHTLKRFPHHCLYMGGSGAKGPVLLNFGVSLLFVWSSCWTNCPYICD